MPLPYREYASTAEIDAQYDPGRRVADEGRELQHFLASASRARATLHGTLDVAYGPTLDETLDIFPAVRPNAPVFVFIHGGYWRALSSKEFSGVALGLHACGITTVVPNYSLCPKVTLDEITRQMRAAVAWVLRHIGAHGGDPGRVAVGGHSAGGHLGAMCLEARWAAEYGLPEDPLAAAVLVSGVYDIEPLRHSYLQPAIRLDDGIVARNSPMFGVRPCKTPLLVTWGTGEGAEFERQARDFHAAWRAEGNAAELMPQAAANHYSAIHGFEDAASPICRWLAGTLGAGP